MRGQRGPSRDAGDEAETRPLQQASVVLVGAARVASVGLRAVATASEGLRLVAEVTPGTGAVAAVSQHRPDCILIAGDGLSESLLSLLRDLHTTSPSSSMVVCLDQVGPDLLLELLKVPVISVLAWPDVTARSLQAVLDLAMLGVRATSASVLAGFVSGTGSEADQLQLTEGERAVIRGLDRELAQGEIARAEGMSERTVRRALESLRKKLGARTLYWVGRLVERYRLGDQS